jgi:16S rRNA (cytosine1402-N4)-methyltransferase
MVILENLREGRLIAFDQDDDARKQAENIQSRSFTFCQANFRYMKQYLKLNGVNQVDGILADLGISSHQIDSPERGFSTRFEGPLDMRMDQKGTITAAKILNDYPEADLHKVFGMYGELKNARTAAKAVIAARSVKPLSTTLDLKAALQQITPRGKENKYFAQVFQALRIEVNEEMKALGRFFAPMWRTDETRREVGCDELPFVGRQDGEKLYKHRKSVWGIGKGFLWKSHQTFSGNKPKANRGLGRRSK